MSRSLALVALVVIIGSGIAIAQTPPAPEPPAPEPPAPEPAPEAAPPAVETPAPAPAAPTYTVTGVVQTKGKRTPVDGASVTVVELDRTEYAAQDGAFTIAGLPAGTYRLRVTAPGHEVGQVSVTAGPGAAPPVKVYLKGSAYSLGEIVVREKRDTPNVSQETIEKEEIFSLPGAGNDPVRAVSNLPGVAKVNPFGAVGGLVIRGVSQEDSGYYLDGHVQPFLFHFGSLAYVFNSELVSEVNYLPGGYGVRYGNALGGIVEVTSRRPRTDRIGGVADLSSYASFLLVEGPIGKKFSFALAGRRSFIDYLFPLFIPKDQGTFTVLPSFWDYQGMADVKANAAHKIELTVFGANDEVGAVAGDKQKEGDQIAQGQIAAFLQMHRQNLAWLFEPSATMKNELSAFNIYSFSRVEIGRDLFIDGYLAGPGIREEFSWQAATWNRPMFGAEFTVPTFGFKANLIRPPKEGDPGPPSFSDDLAYQTDLTLTTWFLGAYIQDEMDVGKIARITPGLRFNYLGYNHTWSFDPRLFVRVEPLEKLAVKVGIGEYHQIPKTDELHEDFGNPELEHENSYQLNVGVEYEFPEAIRVEAQGYYKVMDHLVARNPDLGDVDHPYKNVGIGVVYGAELLVRKKLTDFWYAWLAYSFTVSRRNDDPGDGEGWPAVLDGFGPGWRWFDADVTHNFTILASFVLPRGFKIGAKWQYVTGTPYTPIEGSIYSADTDTYLPVYSPRINSKRNQDLHQLDLRMDKAFTFKTWELSLYIDIQNAYLQPQPFGYAYNYDFTERGMVVYPLIIPSLGLTARF